jgi:hypothetical protein
LEMREGRGESPSPSRCSPRRLRTARSYGVERLKAQPRWFVKPLARMMASILAAKVKASSKANVEGIAADALNRVAKEAEEIERLQPRLERARQELHAAIKDAHAEGASVSVIAKVANLSRQRVDQLVKVT